MLISRLLRGWVTAPPLLRRTWRLPLLRWERVVCSLPHPPVHLGLLWSEQLRADAAFGEFLIKETSEIWRWRWGHHTARKAAIAARRGERFTNRRFVLEVRLLINKGRYFYEVSAPKGLDGSFFQTETTLPYLTFSCTFKMELAKKKLEL